MSQNPIPKAEAAKIIEAIERKIREGFPPPGVATSNKFGAVGAAIKDLYPDIPRGSIQGKFQAAVKSLGREPNWEQTKPLVFPDFPSSSVPTDELIDRLAEDFERRYAAEKARKWYKVNVRDNGPIGVVWFGDPHLDDNYCNWPLLKQHVEIIRKTPGMFGANVGDSENNWAGRLAHLYAEQETSRATAKQLVQWFFGQAGIDWLVIIFGNHDLWNNNTDILSRMERGGAPIANWQAQFKLAFPNGREAKIWAAHDFPGNSMWNPLHGPQKTARFTGDCHLYVCGHKHNWALFQSEDDHRSNTYWLARARGYKYVDHYAEKLGFGSQEHGASIVSVFDPDAEGPGFVQCFADVEPAADYLTWLRKRRGV